MQRRTDNIMNPPAASPHDDGEDFIEDDDDEVFIDEGDIVQEIPVDEEELPEAEAEDDDISDSDVYDGVDDSIHIFTGHTGEVYTVACSPTDPSLVATGGGDDKGFMWSVGQGDWAFELDGHTDSVSSVGFSTDGQFLASGSLDGLVKLWDVSSKSLKYTFDDLAGSSIEWVRWHPSENLVLAGSEDRSALMWNADEGTYFNIFQGHSSSVTCGDFTPDGRTICTGSEDATMRIWNTYSGEVIHNVRGYPYHTKGLTCLTISSDSTRAFSGSKDAAVHVVNIGTGKVISSLIAHEDSVECVGVSPSFGWVATGSLDRKLRVWDVHQNSQNSSPRCICTHKDGVTCLSWLSAYGLATGSLDGKVQIWDIRNGECVKTFSGHVAAIQSLAISANGDYLISASIDHTARAFEIGGFR